MKKEFYLFSIIFIFIVLIAVIFAYFIRPLSISFESDFVERDYPSSIGDSIFEDLMSSGELIAVHIRADVQRGDSKIISYELKNELYRSLNYQIRINLVNVTMYKNEEINSWFTRPEQKTVAESSYDLGAIRFDVPQSVEPGNYEFSLIVWDLDRETEYVSKNFAVNII